MRNATSSFTDRFENLDVQSIVAFGQITDPRRGTLPLEHWPWRSVSMHEAGAVYSTGRAHLVGDEIVMGNQIIGENGARIFVEVLSGDRKGQIIEHRDRTRSERVRWASLSILVDRLGADHPTRAKAEKILRMALDISDSYEERRAHEEANGIDEDRWGPSRSDGLELPIMPVTAGQEGFYVPPEERRDAAQYADNLGDGEDAQRAVEVFDAMVAPGQGLTEDERRGLAAESRLTSGIAGGPAMKSGRVGNLSAGSVVVAPQFGPQAQMFESAPVFSRHNLRANFAPAPDPSAVA